ncbi:hypothetical protein AAFF_G00116250 [Aldrovandia affinis]|uniref:MTTase N-terminal domain-containing protein n=1 Tax=Aldrovandia affinis TaxID=143900 RepID=A0AAD7T1H4_9TELE|nr:hypothetical protein AAFF_G00116250 [Aldrovandia affinis]
MPSVCNSLIDDIEDMVSAQDPTPNDRRFARKSIVPRPRRRKEQQTTEELQTDSIIPGTQKIWMRTWGCSHNNSDGEYMAGQLAASGYKMTENPAEADLWLLNSCTVKNPAEDHFRNSINVASLLPRVGLRPLEPGSVQPAAALHGLQQVARWRRAMTLSLKRAAVQPPASRRIHVRIHGLRAPRGPRKRCGK